MSDTFDLTTTEGRRNAMKFFDRYGWVISPHLWLIKKVYESISKSDINTIEAQKEAAIELIKAGKNNNVNSMKITLEQTAGIDLGSEVEGIPIKCKIGKSGTMTIDVQYKDA